MKPTEQQIEEVSKNYYRWFRNFIRGGYSGPDPLSWTRVQPITRILIKRKVERVISFWEKVRSKEDGVDITKVLHLDEAAINAPEPVYCGNYKEVKNFLGDKKHGNTIKRNQRKNTKNI